MHIFIALPNPTKQCLKEIESMFFGFLWSGKNDKIKRSKLTQNYEQDGLRMIDINQSMEWIELKRSSPVQIHEPLILIQSNPADEPESESSQSNPDTTEQVSTKYLVKSTCT